MIIFVKEELMLKEYKNLLILQILVVIQVIIFLVHPYILHHNSVQVCHYSATISSVHLIVVCPCGTIEVLNVKEIKTIGIFSDNSGKIYSTTGLKEGMAAIAFDNNTINIWQILTNNKFSPKYLVKLYGQTALFLHYEDKNNIFHNFY